MDLEWQRVAVVKGGEYNPNMSPISRKLQQSSLGSMASGTVTHGDEITAVDVGYTAYYDSSLGRTLQFNDLEQMPSGTHWISDFVSAGGTLKAKHFTGTVVIDVDNVTLVGCLFDYPVTGYLNGVNATGWVLDYCTIDPVVVNDQAIYFQGYTANRCYVAGCSDGVKANGGSTILSECYIRVKLQSVDDHNDGVQNVGGVGAVQVVRCNIDCRPIGEVGSYGNSALFFADGETGLHTIHDNLLAGGQICLAMYDTGTFDVQGNKFVRNSYNVSTHAMAGPGSGSQNVTWGTIRANTFSDNGQLINL